MESYPPVLGPILKEDRLFLQALLLQQMPKTVVQFGHLLGLSAEAMLEVMLPDAELISIDINPECPLPRDPRCRLLIQDQRCRNGIPEEVDFVFLDASHGFNDNQSTFLMMFQRLRRHALIVIHDTGMWPENPYPGYTQGEQRETCYVHHPEEHKFVNWIHSQLPSAEVISFRTLRAFRHGFTIVQRKTVL